MSSNELLSLFSFRKRRWFEQVESVSFVTALVSFGFIGLSVTAGDGSFLQKVGLYLMAISFAVGVLVGGIQGYLYDAKHKKAILSRLEAIPSARLAPLVSSPEVSDRNQRIVLEFLNAHRAGWSFPVEHVKPTANTVL